MASIGEWDLTQQIWDLYSLLSSTASRELHSLSAEFRNDTALVNELQSEWTHVSAGLMLVGSLALVEAEGLSTDLGQEVLDRESGVLRCIRNAYAHTGRALHRVRDDLCAERVVEFGREIDAGSIRYDNTVVHPYYTVSAEGEVRLLDSAFNRIRIYVDQIVEAQPG